MSLRACVIGCGMFGGFYENFNSHNTYSHAKAYFDNPDFSNIGFFDIDISKAELIAKKANGIVFSDLKEMIKTFQPDVVSIVTPDNTHFAVTKEIIELPNPPKLVFIEKPVCCNAKEFEIIKKLERKSKSKIIINHSRRYDSRHQEIKALIDEATFGSLNRIQVNYYGGWQHLAIHIVDYLHYIFGKYLKIDRAKIACPSRLPNDPTLHIDGFISKAPINFVGFDESYYQVLEMTMFFELGQIKFTNFGKQIDVFNAKTNAEGERVLFLNKKLSGPAMKDPMINAVNLISKYIKNPKFNMLLPYGLKEAEKTMSVIWKGQTINEN